jgi:integrase
MSRAFKTIKAGSVSVPIYRNVHRTTASGVVYTVSYYDSLGVRRSFQRVSLECAEAEARRIASQLAACKAEAVAFSSHEREELLAARKLCGGTPLISAINELAEAKKIAGDNLLVAARAWADANNRSFKPKTVREVVDEYVEVKTRAGKNVGKNHASVFRNIQSEMGDRWIHEIETPELNRFLQLRSDPWTAVTYRKRLVAIFRWAQGHGYCARNGRTAAEFTELPSTPVPQIGIMSPDCFESLIRLVAEKSPRDIPALILAGMCGMRRKEVHSQNWEDVLLDRGFVTVSNAKKGTFSYRRIPLCAAAVAWLRAFKLQKGSVCEGVAIDRVRKLGRGAGLDLKDNALRHSFVSYRVEILQNRHQVALEAGHSEGTLTKHYRENVGSADAISWFGIMPEENCSEDSIGSVAA